MVDLIFKCLCCLVIFAGCKDTAKSGIELYKQGEFQKALPLLKPLCIRGDLQSCLATASIYSQEKDSLSQLKAIKALDLACKYGDLPSCNLAFRAYAKKFPLQAFNVLQKGCQWGDASFCYKLASYYYGGHLVERNKGMALDLLIKSCYGDNQKGCEVAIWILENEMFDKKRAEMLKKQLKN